MTSRHPMRLTGITLLIALFIGAFGIPLASLAKDTDVYLKAQGAARDDSPNILIILDNSGSMNTAISAASRLAYDPSRDYSAESGSPGFDNNRVYWSSNGTPPSNSSTSRWVSVSNNNCTSSSANLGAGGSGMYSGDKVVGWKRNSGSSYPPSGTTKGAWTSLSNSGGNNGGWGDTVLECKLDNPADASGTYVATNSTNYNARYVNSPAPSATWWNSKNTVILFSGNYMNYIRNNDKTNTNVWDPAVTRISAAKAAVNAIIDSTQNVRFGLMVYNDNNLTPNGGRVIMKVDTMDAARRTAMQSVVNSISATTFTPLAETMWEAYRYLGGLSVDYGNPTSESPVQDPCAQNSTGSCSKDGTYESPFKYACQKGYIIYVTDGDPTNDSDANASIRTQIGKTSCDTSTAPNGDTVTSCLDDLAEWMSKNDVYSGITGNQTVVSYTVGFGGSISPSGLKLLQDTATKSGGKYYDAGDADQLTTALSDALFEILQVTTSYAAPTLSVNAFNTLYNRDDVYFAQFKPSSTVLWDGNVKKYSLCKATTAACTFGDLIDSNGNKAVDLTTNKIKDTASSFWNAVVDGNNVTVGGAGAQIPTASSRNVYTYTGGYNATDGRTPSGGNTDLTNTNNLVEDSNTSLTAAMFNVPTAPERTTIIDWLRGVDVRDYDTDGNVTEDRWRFADPIHSRPIAVNYGGTSAAPVIKLFVGSNDGGLRMINENTGAEEWVFYPQEVLAMLNDLSFDNDGEHLWGIDGSVAVYAQDRSQSGATVVDVPDGIIDPSATGVGDFVHVYAGMRRGGNNIYALDVTPGSILTSPSGTGGITPKLMWVIRGGTGGTPGFASLAQTWSKPQIAKIRYAGTSSKTVLIFAGGYDAGNDGLLPAKSPATGNAIYIVDPSTGERLWWAGASPAGCSGTDCPDLPLSAMTYSIPSDLALMDANADGYVDRIYVGDLGGQIWRIDLSPSLQKNTNGGSSGYVFANLAGSSTQDKRKFYYPPDIAQVYDATYEDLSQAKHDLVTIASGDREDPIDIITSNMVPTQTQVHNRIYVMRDYNTSNLKVGGTLSYPASITDAVLYDATANSLQTATGSALATEIADIKSKKGWYIDLSNSGSWVGEKSLAQPTIYAGTLYVSTFTPASAATASLTCSADEGLAKLYGLNILNGGASSDWDYDGTGTINTADRSINVGGGIPPETVIIIRSEGNSGLVGVTNVPKLSQNPGRSKSGWFVK